jgi:hypothetical protein
MSWIFLENFHVHIVESYYYGYVIKSEPQHNIECMESRSVGSILNEIVNFMAQLSISDNRESSEKQCL